MEKIKVQSRPSEKPEMKLLKSRTKRLLITLIPIALAVLIMYGARV